MVEHNDNRLALVTGASRGIGKAVALRLAAEGWQVVGTATTERGAAGIGEALAEAGFGDSAGAVLNLSDGAGLDAQLAAIWENHGAPLAVVSNAGITRDALVMRQTPEDFEQVLQVNLTGAFQVVRKSLRAMLKARWGRIVCIGSVSAAMGNPGQAAYAASKAGLSAMVRALAKEVSSRGITANTVEPGFVATDMTANFSEEMQAAYESAIPVGRFGQPEEIAAAVSFLLGDQAGYMTGQTLRVDGGLYMG